MSNSKKTLNICYVDGCRIPFQKPDTGYRSYETKDLARFAIRAVVDRSGIRPEDVDHVIFGSVTPDMTVDNPARSAALAAGLPASVIAHTITMSDLSSQQAIATGVERIMSGQAEVVIAGGVDMTSPSLQRFSRYENKKQKPPESTDAPAGWLNRIRSFRTSDLLPDTERPASGLPERHISSDIDRADRLASLYRISREIQDAFTVRSHQSAVKATNNGLFEEERIPVAGPPDFTPVTGDNVCRFDCTPKTLASLKPLVQSTHSTITYGNITKNADGASAVLIMSPKKAKELGLNQTARIRSYRFSAGPPGDDNTPGLYPGAAFAIPALLDQHQMKLTDIDVFEFHESSAAETLGLISALSDTGFAKEQLGKNKAPGSIPMKKLNTHGGSLAIGNPPAATGARLIITAVNRLKREKGKRALVASGAADGTGHAMLLEINDTK